jgi:hypothetical protein
MMSRVARAVAVGLFGALALAACSKAKEGDACKTEGKLVCNGKDAALVCVDGKWLAQPCRGAAGCSGTGEAVECANNGYLPGEPCSITEDDHECSVDHKAQLKCDGKKWRTVDKCLGPKACTTSASEVHCDDTLTEVGAECSNEGSFSCSVDGKELHQCKGSKVVLDSPCRGAGGCKANGDKMRCDTTIAAAGDACEDDEAQACSVDLKQLLACKGKKMVLGEKCKKACVVAGETVSCN